MSVIDILTRVNALCKKYDKYDLDRQKDLSASNGDPFLRLYTFVVSEMEATVAKSNEAAVEKNRATVATLNAEVRRHKAALKGEVPKLQKLAFKKVKGVSKEELETRSDVVAGLAQKIEDIPDGTSIKRNNGWTAGSKNEIKIDIVNPVFDADDNLQPEHYEETAESKGFRSEFERRKQLQDIHLDHISDGLATLKDMAGDINEELDKQVPLIDEIDTKVDKASADLKNTNQRLKEVVTQMRSSRNFCIDITLLIIILGIAAYLYKVLK
ncbi:unnamed protein product [Calypogeia fissa]